MQNPHCSAPVAAKAAASSSRSLGRHALERGDRRCPRSGRAGGCSSPPPCRRPAPCSTRTDPTASSRPSGTVTPSSSRSAASRCGWPVVDGHLGAVEREVRAHRAQASSPPVGLSTTGRRRREASGGTRRESRPWPPRSSPTRVAAPGPPEAAPSSPSPSTAACRGTRSRPLVAAPVLAAELGLAELRVKVESSRLGLPAFKMLGASWATYRAARRAARRASRRGRTSTSCAPPSRRSGRSRWPPPPTATTAGRWPGWPGCSGTAPASSCRPAPPPPASTASSRRARRSTVVDGTYDDAVAASAAVGARRRARHLRHVVGGLRRRCRRGSSRGTRRSSPRSTSSSTGRGPTSSSCRWAWARSPPRWSSTSRPSAAVVAVEPLRAACGLRSARGGPPGRGARPPRLDHGRAQLRHGLGRRLADGRRRRSTCSSRSTTRPPSRRCATSPRSASWRARPARPAWLACGPSSSRVPRRSTSRTAPPSSSAPRVPPTRSPTAHRLELGRSLTLPPCPRRRPPGAPGPRSCFAVRLSPQGCSGWRLRSLPGSGVGWQRVPSGWEVPEGEPP